MKDMEDKNRKVSPRCFASLTCFKIFHVLPEEEKKKRENSNVPSGFMVILIRENHLRERRASELHASKYFSDVSSSLFPFIERENYMSNLKSKRQRLFRNLGWRFSTER